MCYDRQKNALINHILQKNEDYQSIIIFASTRKKVGELKSALSKRNYDVEAVSSDLEQKEREAVLAKFKAKKIKIIVSTDVLSRGIDIKDINLVVNYGAPRDAEEYIHRIGRTARAGNNGHAITLVNEEDMYNFAGIENLMEKEVPKIALPEALGDAPTWNPKKSKKRKNYSGKKHYGNKSKGKRNNSKGNNKKK